LKLVELNPEYVKLGRAPRGARGLKPVEGMRKRKRCHVAPRAGRVD